MIASLAGQGHSAKACCRILGVAPSGFFYWRNRPPTIRELRRKQLTALIADIHHASNGTYGTRRITAELRFGYEITANRKAVRATVIQALAGTGKTYTAAVLREVYESAGYDVLGVAPTARAARELEEQAGIPARTLDRLLLEMDALGEELPARSVLILDDAGMAPTRGSAILLEAAQAARAKVIAIGDPGQLASVRAGGWLRAVGEALGVLSLTEVMRQRDPAERRALAALHEGAAGHYVEWADAVGRIETFGHAQDACQRAVGCWAEHADAVGPAQAVMVARDNETREELNVMARELRRALGELGDEETYGSLSLAVGDRMICRRNNRGHDVDNGMRGTVRHLDPQRVVIDTDSGLVRELPAAYVEEHMEHAYALTGHGMQGGTVEAAVIVASPRDLSAGWSYTALSRAREQTRLMIYDHRHRQERSEFSPREPSPNPSRADLLSRVERRMVQRDDDAARFWPLKPSRALVRYRHHRSSYIRRASSLFPRAPLSRPRPSRAPGARTAQLRAPTRLPPPARTPSRGSASLRATPLHTRPLARRGGGYDPPNLCAAAYGEAGGRVAATVTGLDAAPTFDSSPVIRARNLKLPGWPSLTSNRNVESPLA